MAHAINDTCVSCGACESTCPVGAISMGDDHMQIDAPALVFAPWAPSLPLTNSVCKKQAAQLLAVRPLFCP